MSPPVKQRPSKGGGVTGGRGTFNATLGVHLPRSTPVMGHARPADKSRVSLAPVLKGKP